MCVAIIHVLITDEGGTRGISDNGGGRGDIGSWRGRDHGRLMCTVVTRDLSRKLAEPLLVLEVEVCCTVQQRLAGFLYAHKPSAVLGSCSVPRIANFNLC